MNREIDYAYFYFFPAHIQDEAKAYIEKGTLPGPFLQAIICNKLKESFEEADKLCVSEVFDPVCFFRNEALPACWGSKKRMVNWITFGGLEGRKYEIEHERDLT